MDRMDRGRMTAHDVDRIEVVAERQVAGRRVVRTGRYRLPGLPDEYRAFLAVGWAEEGADCMGDGPAVTFPPEALGAVLEALEALVDRRGP